MECLARLVRSIAIADRSELNAPEAGRLRFVAFDSTYPKERVEILVSRAQSETHRPSHDQGSFCLLARYASSLDLGSSSSVFFGLHLAFISTDIERLAMPQVSQAESSTPTF
jgi:hypothetical protein